MEKFLNYFLFVECGVTATPRPSELTIEEREIYDTCYFFMHAQHNNPDFDVSSVAEFTSRLSLIHTTYGEYGLHAFLWLSVVNNFHLKDQFTQVAKKYEI